MGVAAKEWSLAMRYLRLPARHVAVDESWGRSMPDFNPTIEQQAILQFDLRRHARVFAGPGTGKSATLVALVDELLSQTPTPRVKLLTFTRAATTELAKKISEHPAAAAERPSTIHSFAISILLHNSDASGLPEPLRIADDWEDKTIVRRTLARRAHVSQRQLDRLVAEMAANWESLCSEEDSTVDQETRSRFMGAWREHRQVYGYTLLAELPYALRCALRDYPDIEGLDYDLLVVDEYQDLNACDLDVIRMIADRGCRVIAAGDDDQSIYSFRCAAPEGIRRFPADYEHAADYPLSVTQRCGSDIIRWASYVIEGDPDRPRKARLKPAKGSPAGHIALLSFADEKAEAKGIAELIQKLVENWDVPPSEILVLLRGDHNGMFSKPIKEEMERLGIGYSDPDVVARLLATPQNRQMLEVFRLLVHGEDSIAWASLLCLTQGVGDAFLDYIYERARTERITFGRALLDAYGERFADGPKRSSEQARAMMACAIEWIKMHPVPESDVLRFGWGHWIIETAGGPIVPSPSEGLAEMLVSLDGLIEAGQGLDRYLGQIAPLGKDLALANSEGVRIMTMGGSKGLTVQATIIAGLEEGIVPRPDADLAEERRLLYVAMTRARTFLFGTWARRRRGPTARAGAPRVALRRQHSTFLDGGPVESEDGSEFLRSQ